MLSMNQYDFIRTGYRLYKKPIKQLVRETGHSRNTIRKVISNEYVGYSSRKSQPMPVLGDYHSRIDCWLEADKDNPEKQRHTARRIYNRLKEEYGFSGCESNVRRYVREAKRRIGLGSEKAFIPSDPMFAREAEMDWGTATAIIAGQRQKVHVFVMRPRYSGKPFVCCYSCERQQVLFDGHMRAFAFFGGIFETIVYDNLKTAVKKILRGKSRIEQESFTKFRSYYNFQALFCNRNSGHEKGGVEGLVGFSRRNFMVPLPEAPSIEALNEMLLKRCIAYGDHVIAGRDRPVQALYEAEKSHLIPLPDIPFNNIQIMSAKVNRYSTAIIDRNRYSVPTQCVGITVRVELTGTHVTIYANSKQIARHRRLYGSGKWQLNPDHYLSLLQKRPGAFHSARPIRQWRVFWPAALERLLESFQSRQGTTEGIKDFINVLMLYRDHKANDVNAAVELAFESHIKHSEGVKHILLHSYPEMSITPLSNWPVAEKTDVSNYAILGAL